MTEVIDVGVTGCGRVTERCHLPALLGLERFSIVGVVDPNVERRRLIAARAGGCPSFPSVQDMLAACPLDAMIVASPPETHTRVALLAIEAGIPVLIEKPLAPSLEDAERFSAAVVAMNGKVLMGFNRRWWTPLVELRKILESDYADTDLRVDMIQIGDLRSWDPCGPAAQVLDDLGCHQLDLLRFLIGGKVESLEARTTSRRGGQTGVEMRIEMAREGARVEGTCYVAHGRPSAESIEVVAGRDRFLVHDRSDRLRRGSGVLGRGRDFLDAARRRLTRRPSAMTRSFELQLRHFADVVESSEEPTPGLADGLAAARLVDAARQRIE